MFYFKSLFNTITYIIIPKMNHNETHLKNSNYEAVGERFPLPGILLSLEHLCCFLLACCLITRFFCLLWNSCRRAVLICFCCTNFLSAGVFPRKLVLFFVKASAILRNLQVWRLHSQHKRCCGGCSRALIAHLSVSGYKVRNRCLH